MSQSASPRSIPVGVLVSVGKRRHAPKSLADYGPISKGANIPLKIGLAFGGAMACLAFAMVVLVLRTPRGGAAESVARKNVAPARPQAPEALPPEPEKQEAAAPVAAPDVQLLAAPLQGAQVQLAAFFQRLVAPEPA